MFEFKVAEHLYNPKVKIVEAWNEGEFMAGIYLTETGIKIISKHLPLSPEEVLKSMKIDCSHSSTTISIDLSQKIKHKLHVGRAFQI
jgi:hypothetical protein